MSDESDFYRGLTLQEPARLRGVTPLRDIAELAGVISADEAAEFLAAIDESDSMELNRVSD